MWGKHFESMYEGSMYGAGVAVFAVWGYVISHARNGQVELNPRKLADTLGGTLEEIRAAVTFLMSPDPNSRFKDHEGRRLVKNGEFQYEMPSWQSYHLIRNEDDRREYNKLKQREYRARRRELRRAGACAGATQAVQEGLADLQASNPAQESRLTP